MTGKNVMENKKEKKERKEKKAKNPVLRKLRIEFIITMMSIVVLFLLTIFGVQYITSKKAMENDSQNALAKALNSTSFPWDRPDADPDFPGPGDSGNAPGGDFAPEGDLNRPGKKGQDYHISDFKDRQDRVAILVAFYNTDQTVDVERNNIFFISSTEDVTTLVTTAVAEKEDTGILDDHNLRYRKKTLNNGVIAVAFADISNELSLLNSEMLRSLWIGLGVFAVMLILSFWLSRITTRPVERAWNDQRRFVADASHELKTPLTVIMSNTDMVERSLHTLVEEADPDAEETSISIRKLQRNLRRMDNLREESLRMKELIGELLEVARGDMGQHPDDFTEISLSEIAGDALLSWESVFYEAGKTLTGDVDPELSITGDRTLLRRLIEILIDNALKYSDAGSTVVLTLKRGKYGGHKATRLSVENKGTPLTPEEISHLFDRFYRADSSREKTSGYGLGLSIAQEIVKAHKGRIQAEATSDGNRFLVDLPF